MRDSDERRTESRESRDDLSKLTKADIIAIASKGAAGWVPFAGTLLAEIAGNVIPNQRIDRLTRLAIELNERLGKVEESTVKAHLTNDEFTDMVEEGMRQAGRATSQDRIAQIANVIANSLTAEDVTFAESQFVLKILGEINDVEVIWLRSYVDPTFGGDAAYRQKHETVLKPVAATMGSSRAVLDKSTFQRSYKQHLVRLDLLKERYKLAGAAKVPELERDGHPKVSGDVLAKALDDGVYFAAS